MTKESVPLVVRRLIQSSPSRIFEAFSSARILSQWFVPSAEVAVDVLAFDFTIGGRYRLRYTMPAGRQAVVSGAYEDIVPPSRIAVSWVWEAPDPLADIPMRVTFEFFAQNKGTEVVVTHEGIPSDIACTIHEDGWEGTLNNLDGYLGTP